MKLLAYFHLVMALFFPSSFCYAALLLYFLYLFLSLLLFSLLIHLFTGFYFGRLHHNFRLFLVFLNVPSVEFNLIKSLLPIKKIIIITFYLETNLLVYSSTNMGLKMLLITTWWLCYAWHIVS